MRRLLVFLPLLAVISAAAATALAEAPASPVRSDAVLGLVPSRQAAQAGGMGDLAYHLGRVMRTNKVYAIYWVPAGFSTSAGYQSLINGFFTNVAQASGKTTNVYYGDTQYSDGTGKIAYKSSYGGSYVDTNTFPASGCTDPYTSVCLTDLQLQTEISRVIKLKKWSPSLTTAFFLFTPRNVGSCVGAACAYGYFCAYHSSFGPSSSPTLYANEPYASFVPAACDAGQHPNGDDADATLNVVSHEHNETITDPLGNAWFDAAGYENGDKCAWSFGTPLGSTASGQYNQLIGTGKYYLQQEWSNATHACVLTGT
jgi:hypothetical protein